ncbi:uncharacterized protein LOC130165110 isoform X1 [Seriola aureovittata]|uniref:uncharacterized protein LOC130165110 isoform X1 n=1 Tax=Seriola aureovittata TaxID=2871759 RepID=UPI0024BEC582|nr:uncharacterized protein LOC130165110 isoform X1 [Seriola aureovittata]XP_056226015.1 uncharacterized protein LOC130165110 isoform X1 [Seriola aureovittata]
MWTAGCTDEVCEGSTNPDRSFVIGWPTSNCVATFSSTEQKERWLSTLRSRIKEEKEKEEPKTIPLRVYGKGINTFAVTKTLPVSNSDSTNEVIRLALRQFGIIREDLRPRDADRKRPVERVENTVRTGAAGRDPHRRRPDVRDRPPRPASEDVRHSPGRDDAWVFNFLNMLVRIEQCYYRTGAEAAIEFVYLFLFGLLRVFNSCNEVKK